MLQLGLSLGLESDVFASPFWSLGSGLSPAQATYKLSDLIQVINVLESWLLLYSQDNNNAYFIGLL